MIFFLKGGEIFQQEMFPKQLLVNHETFVYLFIYLYFGMF